MFSNQNPQRHSTRLWLFRLPSLASWRPQNRLWSTTRTGGLHNTTLPNEIVPCRYIIDTIIFSSACKSGVFCSSNCLFARICLPVDEVISATDMKMLFFMNSLSAVAMEKFFFTTFLDATITNTHTASKKDMTGRKLKGKRKWRGREIWTLLSSHIFKY